ncbi:MAG: pyrroline-5-carboxylate reductase [Cyanobacteria bacterium RUI128]|nr:pyrroline-5-carboxylate reductase [Cyanobacteria bacterium RUI128]
MNKKLLGFIGCGKMASAIIGGVLSSGFAQNENIQASERSEEHAKSKSEELGIDVITDNIKLVETSRVVFIATTPNFAEDVLKEIKDYITNDHLIVSICAGVTTKFIESIIGEDKRVVRVMPNTPALVLEGMSGVCKGKHAWANDVQFVLDLLSNIGEAIEVTEDQMDIVTAISGSGPAFYYKVINEIARAGEKLGLEYKKALTLSIQTAIGSAKMLLNSNKSAEDLIASVATKGGCTRVGVDYMDEADTSDIFYNLIDKTAKKANSLGK